MVLKFKRLDRLALCSDKCTEDGITFERLTDGDDHTVNIMADACVFAASSSANPMAQTALKPKPSWRGRVPKRAKDAGASPTGS
jgi:hypothetical protein